MGTPVFNGSPGVITDTTELTSDNSLPNPGKLTWGSSATALAGTKGVDCILITGDVWREIQQGGETRNIDHNLTTTVMWNEVHNVTKTRNSLISKDNYLTVVGDQHVNITGTHNTFQVGPQNDVRVSPHNRMNSGPDSQQEPAEKTRVFLGVVCDYKETENTWTNSKMEVVNTGFAFNGLKDEFTAVNLEVKGVDMCAVLGISVEPKVSEVNLEPLHTFLKGAEGKAAAGSAALAPSVATPPHIPLSGGGP